MKLKEEVSMKSYMVTFQSSGYEKHTRIDQFVDAMNFAESMAKRHNSSAKVRNYDTDEVVYAVDPKIDLDNNL